MNDVDRLRATIFERTGIAIDPEDPVVAVLVASTVQAEDVGRRLLRQSNPARAVLLSGIFALAAAAAGAWAAWQVADHQARLARAEWLRQQADPRTAALLASEQGRAGLHLAELGVATLLARCTGRPSWHVASGYCVPRTGTGEPDGFRFSASSSHLNSRGK